MSLAIQNIFQFLPNRYEYLTAPPLSASVGLYSTGIESLVYLCSCSHFRLFSTLNWYLAYSFDRNFKFQLNIRALTMENADADKHIRMTLANMHGIINKQLQISCLCLRGSYAMCHWIIGNYFSRWINHIWSDLLFATKWLIHLCRIICEKYNLKINEISVK